MVYSSLQDTAIFLSSPINHFPQISEPDIADIRNLLENNKKINYSLIQALLLYAMSIASLTYSPMLLQILNILNDYKAQIMDLSPAAIKQLCKIYIKSAYMIENWMISANTESDFKIRELDALARCYMQGVECKIKQALSMTSKSASAKAMQEAFQHMDHCVYGLKKHAIGCILSNTKKDNKNAKQKPEIEAYLKKVLNVLMDWKGKYFTSSSKETLFDSYQMLNFSILTVETYAAINGEKEVNNLLSTEIKLCLNEIGGFPERKKNSLDQSDSPESSTSSLYASVSCFSCFKLLLLISSSNFHEITISYVIKYSHELLFAIKCLAQNFHQFIEENCGQCENNLKYLHYCTIHLISAIQHSSGFNEVIFNEGKIEYKNVKTLRILENISNSLIILLEAIQQEDPAIGRQLIPNSYGLLANILVTLGYIKIVLSISCNGVSDNYRYEW